VCRATQLELKNQSLKDLPLVCRGYATYEGSQIEGIDGLRKSLCVNLIAYMKQQRSLTQLGAGATTAAKSIGTHAMSVPGDGLPSQFQ